jgi:hypothetical protein
MYLILRNANGQRAEALLLAMTADVMRVVVSGCDETIEYRRAGPFWVGDDGARVFIEAMLAAAAVQPAGDRGRTLSAGN